MSGNNPGLDIWRATEGLFDRPFRAALDMAEPTIELEDNQVVCDRCYLVHWEPLGYCPHCEAGADNYQALAALVESSREAVRAKIIESFRKGLTRVKARG